MKKIFAIFFILLLTSNIASARSVMVRYGNTGAIKSITRGTGSMHRFGSNAAFTPENRIRAGQRLRARRYENAMINALNNRNNHQISITTASSTTEVSRFNKDYTIKPQKSYTQGGVTYYD